jgi:hypothetical protein
MTGLRTHLAALTRAAGDWLFVYHAVSSWAALSVSERLARRIEP